MREFRCSSLGYDCAWRHIASEQAVTDMTALHLREIHGMTAIDSRTVERIGKLLTEPTSADAAAAAGAVVKEYNCNIGSHCPWRYVAMTEDIIIQGAAAHAREQHGIRTFRRELIARVRKSIHAWTGGVQKRETG